ncbi:hypothetical protein BY458DRAFT_529730 [Sporodiniella umbellata]|nr:hypothetical protein BY458DRAFT_529730 [Sporodiniella umbellata]
MISTFYHTFSKDPEPSYANKKMNRTEVEAGSILASLASQNRSRNNSVQSTKNSMSIHSLLDSNVKKEQEYSIPYHRPTSPIYYHRSSISENQSDGYSTPSTPPSCSSYIHRPYDTLSRTASIDKEQSYFKHLLTPAATPETKASHTVVSPKVNKRLTVQSKQKVNNNNSLSQKAPQARLNHHAKIRRNALQAYISYMTYADMKRKKARQPPSEHQPTSIIEQPLTDFLYQSSIQNTHSK